MVKPLRLAYISYSDVNGGAARGALRLVNGFKKAGIDCDFIVRRQSDKRSDAIQYNAVVTAKQQRFNDFLAENVYPKLREQTSIYQSFNLRYTGLDSIINNGNYDVVICHWIGGDTISIKEFARLKIPIIWRLADEWALSGSCHYLEQTDNAHFDGSIFISANRFVASRKERFWRDMVVHYVTGSKWLSNQISQNRFTHKLSTVRVIPSSLETDTFKPLPIKEADYLRLSLNNSKTYILFGAASATTDTRKGWDLLCEALQKMPKSALEKDLELLVFGNREEPSVDSPMPVRFLGEIRENILLAKVFNIATVTVVPSRVDNLPFVAMESMACGTPVVGFNIGGMPDIVDDIGIGELVEPFDTQALADALYTRACRGKSLETVTACREKAVAKYAVPSQVDSYLELINQIIG